MVKSVQKMNGLLEVWSFIPSRGSPVIGPGSDMDVHPHHHLYSDGSVENDLPMKQLSELFNINHFIVSQV